MDNPAPTDVAIQLSAIAWLVLVIVVVLSLGLALLCRRRYVAAVVRLQGRSQVQRNESWSAAPTVPPLRLVVEELADGARPHVAGRILRLRHTILASQLARDVVFWCGFIVLCLFGPALIPALLHAIRTGDTSVLRAVIGLLSLAFSSDFSFSPVWVTLAFSVMWLVVPPILVIATQTAVRPKHVYVPVAAVVAAWLAETMRISWFVAPIAIVVVIATVGGAVLFLHDPRVRGAASSLIVALSVSLTAWTTITLVAVLYFEDGNQADTSFSASDILSLAVYLLVIAATSVGVLFGLARALSAKALQRHSTRERCILATDHRCGIWIEEQRQARGPAWARCLEKWVRYWPGRSPSCSAANVAPASSPHGSTSDRRASHPARLQAPCSIRRAYRPALVVLGDLLPPCISSPDRTWRAPASSPTNSSHS